MVHLESASAALAAGDHTLALNEINRHLSAGHALDGASAWLIAECLAALRKHGEALEFLATALEESTFQTPQRFLAAARIVRDGGRFDLAMLYGLKAKRMAIEDPDINLFLMDLAATTGNHDMFEHVVPALLKAARPDDLNRMIALFGPDRANPFSLDLFKCLAALYPARSEYLVIAYVLARELCDYAYIEQVRRDHPLPVWSARPDLVGAETPLDTLYWCGEERVNRLAKAYPGGTPLPRAPEKRRHLPLKPEGARLHVGYLSADFMPHHATMILLGDVLRHHDRERLEVTLFCHTDPAHLDGRTRPHDWGPIVDVNRLDDAGAAAEIRRRGVDILVDLKGHTAHSRSPILNHGAAALQVAWLGFPGSISDIDLDYVISDRFVTPESAAPHYDERFCRLPHSYQPNDPTRPDPPAMTRREAGLPEDAFVMACFNTSRKISLEVVDLWADILAGTPHAVLWLLEGGARLAANIRGRLQSRGIEPTRVIFSPGLSQERHLARLKAADLALDTFPYNGHTTSSDALWAGLPLVTLRGTNFASRVSQSLLHAIGLPETVADDARGYADLATALANDPGRIRHLRQKLAANRLTTPLYDSRRFAADLERAYRLMHARAVQGLAPETFDVPGG